MRHQIVLVIVVFVVMYMATFFAANIPDIPSGSSTTVVVAPWWIFWTHNLPITELLAIIDYISTICLELSALVFVLCFEVFGKRFSTSTRQLMFTGHYTTKRGHPVHWTSLAFGSSLVAFVFLLLSASILTAAIIAILKFIFFKWFQKLLQRIHDSRMLEVRASLR